MMIKSTMSTQSHPVNRTETTSIGDGDINTCTEQKKTVPRGKLQRLLSGISNSSHSLSNTVKNAFVRIREGFKNIVMKKAYVAEKTPPLDILLLGLVSDESANTVRPRNILSPLLNDGKPVHSDSDINKDNKIIFDYLIKNPTSHLFSSDNIRCRGDFIYFNKPISLVRQGDDFLFITNPMEGRAISKVKIDMRIGTNGEFRGETAMKVLQDKTLTFNSLADLCQKMSTNPQRNITAMQTGNTLAKAFNANKKEAAFLLYGQHRDRFNAFVTVTEAGECVSKFDYRSLAYPTRWYCAEEGCKHIDSQSDAVSDEASVSTSDNNLSASRHSVSPGLKSVREMVKHFNGQVRIINDNAVQRDMPNRKPGVSPVIKALQDQLVNNPNSGKLLRGGMR